MQNMDTRYTYNPKDISHYSIGELKKEFLVEKVFVLNGVSSTYTHSDRVIFGGVTPTTESLEIILNRELGADCFLERCELGVIDIGDPGFIEVDGRKETMKRQDGHYIGKETRQVIFSSEDVADPAKFYISFTPTYCKYLNIKIGINEIKPMETREALTLNERRIYQYVHPNVCENCQLQIGYTISEPDNSWNAMPCHTHERRMEAHVHSDMGENTKILHMMSDPARTEHLVMGNEQVMISSSWPTHSGVGTSNYSFIWVMYGEDIIYTDMDVIPMDELK